ncbi:aminotransferase DegT, partial [Cylindrospermopsis raciborskii CS-506_D]|nr:aminotransferase DegT [Cylindrospermopsis raciborskii CS-506_D]
LQESREAQDRCIILPLYPEMTDKEQMQVVDTLKQVIHEQECSHGS